MPLCVKFVFLGVSATVGNMQLFDKYNYYVSAIIVICIMKFCEARCKCVVTLAETVLSGSTGFAN